MPFLDLRGLTHRYRQRRGGEVVVLRDCSLSAEEGELLAVVGPSGAGKTTLLRIVAGLEKPTAGSVVLGGRRMDDVPPHERGVAMVFQDHPLLPQMTVEENLGFGLRLGKVPTAEIRSRVGEIAERLSIAGLLARLPAELSGGERQRVALGGALVRRPRMLLLDEPLAHLDAPSRLRLRSDLRRWQREFHLTVIHVTHDQEDALAVADRLAVLRLGVVQQTGSPREVYDRPANAFVAGFFGMPPMNLFPARARTRAAAGSGAVGADTDVLVGIRPEHLVATETLAPGEEGWSGVVETVERLGAETWVRVRAAEAVLVVRAGPDFDREIGAPIRVSARAGSRHVFEAATGRRLSDDHG